METKATPGPIFRGALMIVCNLKSQQIRLAFFQGNKSPIHEARNRIDCKMLKDDSIAASIL
jgi:hypothetical protein